MASQHVKVATDATFEELVLKSATPVLVDFWATWCAPCKAIAPVLDKIADEKGANEVAQGGAAVHEALKTALLAKGPEAWDIVTSKARAQRKLEATAKMIIGGKRKEAALMRVQVLRK